MNSTRSTRTEVRTSAVQMLEGKIMASEAALKDLQAEVAAKAERERTMQVQANEQSVRLHAAERERDTRRAQRSRPRKPTSASVDGGYA
ncbi:MAG: hypothetical protein U0231_13755 [Nitrospiraceae bacterium]